MRPNGSPSLVVSEAADVRVVASRCFDRQKTPNRNTKRGLGIHREEVEHREILTAPESDGKGGMTRMDDGTPWSEAAWCVWCARLQGEVEVVYESGVRLWINWGLFGHVFWTLTLCCGHLEMKENKRRDYLCTSWIYFTWSNLFSWEHLQTTHCQISLRNGNSLNLMDYELLQ